MWEIGRAVAPVGWLPDVGVDEGCPPMVPPRSRTRFCIEHLRMRMYDCLG